MSVKLYMDHFSQPSRAVRTLFLLTKTPHQIIQTRIVTNQNKTPEYLKINPFGTVPCIYDPIPNLTLTQSHTIMRYICQNHPESSKNWYPSQNYIKRCKIDEYLDFHHCHTRKCHYYVANTLFKRNKKGEVDGMFVEEIARGNVGVVLGKIQEGFFGKGGKYLVGDQPTIADLSAFFQIQFLLILGEDFTKWPLIKEWLKRMKQIQEVKQANKIFLKLLPLLNPKYETSLV